MAGTITKETIQEVTSRIQTLFLEDQIPWVVGYSGGKDSSATLQLVWNALAALPPEQRNHKPVHVISTDTLVEQPVVAMWVARSLELMERAAREQDMPIQPHRLTPKAKDSYWVNLIGRGYPAPRPTFRWCTSRLKIEPSNRFILEMVKSHGETILVLGTRKAESSRRAANMERHEKKRVRQWLSPNASLPNSWVFSPIEEWTNDDVWFYLMQYENPWNRSNKDLLTMYRGASADNECPLVVDTSTPSCGNSRFGCWVCTLVPADKSMEAMIQNDEEKVWMAPLLEFRNEIGLLKPGTDWINDRNRRDYRRMDGSITLRKKGPPETIHGPYVKPWREELLRRLLSIQEEIRQSAPPDVRDLTLISDEELREIRRIWVLEKHEFDDAVPHIYKEVTGRSYPYMQDIQPGPFGRDEWKLLEELSDGDYVFHELLASILDIEQRSRGSARRRATLKELERVIRRCYYENEDDAVQFELRRRALREAPHDLNHSHQLQLDLEVAHSNGGPDSE